MQRRCPNRGLRFPHPWVVKLSQMVFGILQISSFESNRRKLPGNANRTIGIETSFPFEPFGPFQRRVPCSDGRKRYRRGEFQSSPKVFNYPFKPLKFFLNPTLWLCNKAYQPYPLDSFLNPSGVQRRLSDPFQAEIRPFGTLWVISAL